MGDTRPLVFLLSILPFEADATMERGLQPRPMFMMIMSAALVS